MSCGIGSWGGGVRVWQITSSGRGHEGGDIRDFFHLALTSGTVPAEVTEDLVLSRQLARRVGGADVGQSSCSHIEMKLPYAAEIDRGQ